MPLLASCRGRPTCRGKPQSKAFRYKRVDSRCHRRLDRSLHARPDSSREGGDSTSGPRCTSSLLHRSRLRPGRSRTLILALGAGSGSGSASGALLQPMALPVSSPSFRAPSPDRLETPTHCGEEVGNTFYPRRVPSQLTFPLVSDSYLFCS